jgi:glycosyltransferase involved in cell wall biosynthesis
MLSNSARERPRILFVTSHWPLAAAYGAQQRVLNIARLLRRFGDISFVIVPTELEDAETLQRTTSEFEVRRIIRPIKATPEKSFGKLVHRLRHEFDPAYMATDPYTVSEPDRAALQELIEQHDLVWVHTIRTAHWFRMYRWPHSILDVDDLPSRTYKSAAQSGSSSARRLADHRMARIWHRRELTFQDRFDALTVCSEEDKRYLGAQDKIHVIPNCSPVFVERPRTSPETPRIGFLGNCTYLPNESGVKWFIHDVWPAIKRQLPNAQLRLVGRASEGDLTKLGPDIIGLGWLEDPGEEIASWSVMIVPIKIGSGTRVKVAEGFARKCAVVATAIGAFGYEVHHGEEILLAESAEDFASACLLLLSNSQLREALAGNAYQRFLERWTWDLFENTVKVVLQRCLAGINSPLTDENRTLPRLS